MEGVDSFDEHDVFHLQVVVKLLVVKVKALDCLWVALFFRDLIFEFLRLTKYKVRFCFLAWVPHLTAKTPTLWIEINGHNGQLRLTATEDQL